MGLFDFITGGDSADNVNTAQEALEKEVIDYWKKYGKWKKKANGRYVLDYIPAEAFNRIDLQGISANTDGVLREQEK
jgi:hypothetical protein